MGRGDSILVTVGQDTVARAAKIDVLETARVFFEPQLIAIGMSKDQIEKQTREELEQSLERVNEAINHPDAFGVLRLKVTADIGLVITTAQSESTVEVSILPLLLERKRVILDRLRILKSSEKIEDLQDLAEKTTEGSVREGIEGKIEKLEAEFQERFELQQAQAQEELKAKLALAELQARAEIDMRKAKTRSEIWQSWLARESVASIVGGSLLVLITIILLIAMFFKLAIPEIISNSFLVILGYFFGQATSSVLAHAKTRVDEGSQENDASHKS